MKVTIKISLFFSLFTIFFVVIFMLLINKRENSYFIFPNHDVFYAEISNHNNGFMPINSPDETPVQTDNDQKVYSPSSIKEKTHGYNQRGSIDALWNTYKNKLPTLWVDTAFRESFYGSMADDFREKAYAGDAHAQFLYANRLGSELIKALFEESRIKNGNVDVALWMQKFSESRDFYIQSAANGEPLSANQLKILYALPLPIRDPVEAIAWSLITYAMDSGIARNPCDDPTLACTEAYFIQGLERASFYLIFYNFTRLEAP